MVPAIATRREEALSGLGKMVAKGLGWARKYSLFLYPFVTACCGTTRPTCQFFNMH